MNDSTAASSTIPELLDRATRPGATATSILSPSSLTPTLSNPSDSEAYFNALLAIPPIMSPRGAVGLLAAPARYFLGDAKEKECELYLRAVAIHIGGLVEAMRSGGEQRFVVDVVQACGIAATRCQRSSISRTGVIPAMAHLCTSLSTHPKQPSHILTSAHPEFLQICLTAGHYSYACQFTDQYPVFAVSPYRSSVTSEQYLRYFYLLGMVRLGCNRYRDAIQAFEICITMPSQIISAIQIAARKKMLLTKCLVDELQQDKMEDEELATSETSDRTKRQWKQIILSIPACVSPPVARFIHNAQNALDEETPSPDNSPSEQKPYFYGLDKYNELILAFHSLQISKFESLKEEMTCLLASDGNLGLANQVKDELLPRKVQKLAKVYQVMPLDKLTNKLGLKTRKETEELILRMISRQEQLGEASFHAKMDQEEGVVFFPQDDDSDSEEDLDMVEEQHADLTNRIVHCMELAKRIRNLDVTLTTSQRYQASVQKDGGGKMGSQPRGVAELERAAAAAAAVEGFD